MPKVRSSHIHVLLILFVFASLPLGALAENGSSAREFQLASPVAMLAQDNPGTLIETGSSVPRFQLASPIAFLSNPDSTPVLDSDSTPALAFDAQQTPPAAPPPPQVKQTTREIKRQVRRWHIGGRVGAGFSPEIFMFGLQSQIGPVFSPRVLFRPSAEFGFGELTDMFSLNLEGTYWLHTRLHGQWTPYFGMGPSLNFIHQGASSGDTSFSDFTYKTGFNVFLGAQKNKMFVEMKTSLWSDPAPVLRLFVGYNF
jgi:hypothetical protein